MALKIAINGFGRIGRLVFRAIAEQGMIGKVGQSSAATPFQHRQEPSQQGKDYDATGDQDRTPKVAAIELNNWLEANKPLDEHQVAPKEAAAAPSTESFSASG